MPLLSVEGCISGCTRKPDPHNFLWEINCGPYSNINCFVTDRTLPGSTVQVKLLMAHLHVPGKLMKRVRVEYDGNAAIITDDHQHIGEQFNGLMAASLTGLVGPKFKGDFGCPSTYSLDGYTNAHRMLFHFNKHYFFPFVLDNGNSFFFAFEDKRTAENLVLKFNSIGKDQVSIGSMKTPLLYENILGISYSKNVSVVYAKPLADPIVDDPRDYRYYEYIREYDPFTNEEKDIYG